MDAVKTIRLLQVFVNQIWRGNFGRGWLKQPVILVYGGELPSSNYSIGSLLISGNGWDIKRLMKQIMMSAYRQSAKTTEQNLKQIRIMYICRGAPRVMAKWLGILY
jgi:hypothetical protein